MKNLTEEREQIRLNKVIMVLLDGLQDEVATKHMGYMTHLVEQGKAAKYRVESQLPSVSRPLYELLLTGVSPNESGITSNDVIRLSKEISIFHLLQENKLTSAAAAYYFFSELYNAVPYDPIEHRQLLQGRWSRFARNVL